MTEGKGTFPMLEYSPGELLCDSFSISALLVRAGNKEQLLGMDHEEQKHQIEWMKFIMSDLLPIIQQLRLLAFGHEETTRNKYEQIYEMYKKTADVFQIHLKTKRMFMVGANLTICDIFLCLALTEMYQCIMDPHFRGKIPNVNKLFKHVTSELPEYK